MILMNHKEHDSYKSDKEPSVTSQQHIDDKTNLEPEKYVVANVER